VDVLQLPCSLLGQTVVQVVPGACKRLPHRSRFLAKPLAVRRTETTHQLIVELVAVAGDMRQ
jgi:hypothetical protein